MLKAAAADAAADAEVPVGAAVEEVASVDAVGERGCLVEVLCRLNMLLVRLSLLLLLYVRRSGHSISKVRLEGGSAVLVIMVCLSVLMLTSQVHILTEKILLRLVLTRMLMVRFLACLLQR